MVLVTEGLSVKPNPEDAAAGVEVTGGPEIINLTTSTAARRDTARVVSAVCQGRFRRSLSTAAAFKLNTVTGHVKPATPTAGAPQCRQIAEGLEPLALFSYFLRLSACVIFVELISLCARVYLLPRLSRAWCSLQRDCQSSPIQRMLLLEWRSQECLKSSILQFQYSDKAFEA